MTIILVGGKSPDDFDSTCNACNAVFALQWKRSSAPQGVHYCPFCGDDVWDEEDEEDVWDEEDDDVYDEEDEEPNE